MSSTPLSVHWNTIQIIYSCFVIFVVFITYPMTAYYYIKIWKLRDIPFFVKRYPLLSIITVITFQIVLLIHIGVGIQYMIPNIDYGVISKYYYPYGTQIPFVLLLIRLRFLYYDYNNGLVAVSNVWRSKINDNYNDNDNDNHVPASPTAVNGNYDDYKSNTIYYIATIWLIICEFLVILLFMMGYAIFASFLYPMFLFIDCIIAVIIAYKVRPLRDDLYIHSEFKYLGYIGIYETIMFIIFNQILYSDDEIMKNFTFIIYTFPTYTVGSYICTKYIINKYQQRMITLNDIGSNNDKNDIDPLTTFQAAIQNEDIFDLFALFLVKEFAIENILFLFETMIFKNQCLKNGLINIDDIGFILKFAKKINKKIKKINGNITDIDSFYCNFKYIVNKYIDQDSPFCVNVSFITRNKIIAAISANNNNNDNIPNSPQSINIEMHQTFKKIQSISISHDHDESDMHSTTTTTTINITQLIGLIDDAVIEILKLVTFDSFIRFTETATFKELYYN